jgi:sec-independent protein translocase protein TatA
MGFDSIWHWLLLLVIVLVIFGTGKLAKMGPDLGNAVRGFKKAMHDNDADAEAKKKADGERLQADPPPATSNTTQSQRDSSDVK